MMSLLKTTHESLSTLQLIPNRSLRNYQVESLAKAMTEFYKSPLERISISEKTFLPLERFVFRYVITMRDISFYLLVSERLQRHF